MASIQTVLGNNIKALRKQKEWSRSFLADKLDISVSFLTMVELGQRGVSLALVEDIASVFNVSVPYLFTESNPEQDKAINPVQLLTLEKELQESIHTHIKAFFAEKM